MILQVNLTISILKKSHLHVALSSGVVVGSLTSHAGDPGSSPESGILAVPTPA